MTTDKQAPVIPYFPIMTSMQKGGLSLWLNRRSLLPLTLIPILVSLVTLLLSPLYMKEESSSLILAIVQIPADFTIGLFCALIIVIMMNAPKKEDSKGPVAFSINLSEKKNLLIAAAVAHTLFGYLMLGGFALTDLVAQPMRAALEQQQARLDLAALMVVMLVAGLYVVRFSLLPVLIIGGLDIRAFYIRYKAFGLSLPVFFIKALAMLGIGFVILLPLSITGISVTGEAAQTMSNTQRFLFHFCSAVAAVLAHAWTYASLAYGVRLMIENNEKQRIDRVS